MKRLETREERRQRTGFLPWEDGTRENRRPKYVPDNELARLILTRFRELTRDDPRYDPTRNVLEWCERIETEWTMWEDEAIEVLSQLGRPDQAERDEWERIEEIERDFNEEYR